MHTSAKAVRGITLDTSKSELKSGNGEMADVADLKSAGENRGRSTAPSRTSQASAVDVLVAELLERVKDCFSHSPRSVTRAGCVQDYQRKIFEMALREAIERAPAAPPAATTDCADDAVEAARNTNE
jgi:hypothetical protein